MINAASTAPADVLGDMQALLDGARRDDIETSNDDLARRISDLLTLAYRQAGDMQRRARAAGTPPGADAHAAERAQAETVCYRRLLDRCIALCRADMHADRQIARHAALAHLGLEHAVADNGDALGRLVTRQLAACAALVVPRKLRSRAARQPDAETACRLLSGLIALESMRRGAPFFPRHAFDQWVADSATLAKSVGEQIDSVAALVALLAFERRARRRLQAFEALQDWALDATGEIPGKPRRNGQSEAQEAHLRDIRGVLAKRNRTEWSLDSLWGWFNASSPAATVLRYAAVAAPSFALAYFGQEWTEVARTHSQRLLVATVLVVLAAIAFVFHWTAKARKHGAAPGLPSVFVATVFLGTGAWLISRLPASWERLTCPEQARLQGVACFPEHVVERSFGSDWVLLRAAPQAAGGSGEDEASFVAVRRKDILLDRGGIVVVAETGDGKDEDDEPNVPSPPLVFNLSMPRASAAPAAPQDLAPLTAGLAELARVIAARDALPASVEVDLPIELLASLAGVVERLALIEAGIAGAGAGERARRDAEILRFCYDKFLRERSATDKVKHILRGVKSDGAVLRSCIDAWGRDRFHAPSADAALSGTMP